MSHAMRNHRETAVGGSAHGGVSAKAHARTMSSTPRALHVCSTYGWTLAEAFAQPLRVEDTISREEHKIRELGALGGSRGWPPPTRGGRGRRRARARDRRVWCRRAARVAAPRAPARAPSARSAAPSARALAHELLERRLQLLHVRLGHVVGAVGRDELGAVAVGPHRQASEKRLCSTPRPCPFSSAAPMCAPPRPPARADSHWHVWRRASSRPYPPCRAAQCLGPSRA